MTERSRRILASVCLALGFAALASIVLSLYWFTTGENEASPLRVGDLLFRVGNVVLFLYLAFVLVRSRRGKV